MQICHYQKKITIYVDFMLVLEQVVPETLFAMGSILCIVSLFTRIENQGFMKS